MDITLVILFLIVGLLLTVIGAVSKKAKIRKPMFWIGLPLIGIFVLNMIVALPLVNTSIYSTALGIPGTTLTVGGAGTGGGTYATYQPTAVYSTVNHFNSTAVTGTSYYKAGNQKATTTAISNTDPNTQYQYWVSASMYFVKPKGFNGAGTNTITNDDAYQNGTVTINAYDLIKGQPAKDGNNATLSSGTAKIKFTVLGSALTSRMPFGGVLVIEANNTISQINCFGDGISSTPGSKYQVTYSPTLATDRYVIYEVASGYDVSPDGLVGVTKTFECDFVASSAPEANAKYRAKLIPANYYYVNADGSFALDVEQKLNGLTTRTGLGQTVSLQEWSA